MEAGARGCSLWAPVLHLSWTPTPLAVIPWWLLSVALTPSHLQFDPWREPSWGEAWMGVGARLGSPRPGAVAGPGAQSSSLSGWGTSESKTCCFWASGVPSVKGERKRRKMVKVPHRPLLHLLKSNAPSRDGRRRPRRAHQGPRERRAWQARPVLAAARAERPPCLGEGPACGGVARCPPPWGLHCK